MSNLKNCPCGSGQSFENCCGPFLENEALPATAGQLMRSRYTAYTLNDEAYLLKTWHPSTQPKELQLATTPSPKWLGLKIIGTTGGSAEETSGTVEFIARFRVGGGKAQRIHETSRFVKDGEQWLYLDGQIEAP